ncbi:type IIG restriction enzyme/methyltransferase [Helicobacter pylori]|jgi:Type II restriction enzyme, methylase subunits|uniref:site-specific DNA-methyltransferase (adenine-specific) n=2 Tax=Helicobacter pylori TaxID=210 RepID=O26046_HELPY|nr:class I SAM-dependent DNA methyltransferase [Helicobacter pylori]AAD08556.1 type IIS restriction enzyme R and M protein (ECO57IR) [Helicobacter pylori 26695]AFV42740.1 type IIS restriction enzyme R and M protein (ECO57IR) [Helicobacter pylori 26695]AFV44337.1 type IIS restriction enzyme R and M protein (ECO57IR) [Helicobacter pylori Rif1]AFV45927.1 type IIS restriction enzyme R and M protein (ECO57IR) [Helicobacter pylori Rif2]AJF09719.1 restriction endonuclease [Helicobacter pylori 26695-1
MDYKKLDLPNTNYPNQEQLKAFETAFDAFLETNQQENENHQNDAFNDLLKGVFKYKVKPTKKIDSTILNENNEVEVIIEFKALKNPNEFIKKGDLNVKAFHESLLSYLTERKEGNNNLKHLILATIKELYIIDANEFEVFNKDKEIENAFKNCHDRKGNDTRTKAFYDACQKRLNEFDRSLKYHYIPLKKENLALIYQALSPNFLLKIPKYSDANTLNKDFYEELLYILGLEEQNDKGKILIKPSRTQNSLSDALKKEYKNLDDEEVMALLIAWNNRILFLRLLESLLISFKHFENPFLTTENFENFNDLNTLFFEVLAKKNSERLPEIKEDKILEKIPYLNSSLFDKTPLELKGHEIKLLDNKKLEIYKNSVLKKHKDYQKEKPLPLLKYLFKFLRLYKFTTTPKDIKDNTDTSESRLINPSVLGLVFEKLNGYKEGSFYTPSFITSYMCKESITPIVLDKFNAIYQWDCENLKALRGEIDRNFSNEKAKEYLNTLLTLRICDPAVGSGHFLVSALNEMVRVAYELGLIASLYRYDLKLENDEIIIHHTPTGEIFNYIKPDSENDPHHHIQKELFNLKKSIIENCLFGVDINPNSCEITKLRLWIELLKYSYYIFEKGKNTNALETLPNIDINIKCANSLISRFALKDKALLKSEKNKNLEYSIAEYKELVKIYKDPKILETLTHPIKDSNAVRKYAKERLYQELKQNPNKDFKKALNDRIEKIKKAFKLTLNPPPKELKFKKFLKEHLELYGKSILEEANYNGLELEALALEKQMANLFFDYRPYPKLDKSDKVVGLEHFNRYVLTSYKDLQDENERYANALEWRFEFPEVLDDEGDFSGFDCIIGNPPYIRQEHIKDLKPLLEKQYQDFYNSTADIYTYFFALAFHLLKEKGFSAFITSNKYTRAKYGAKLREWLLKKTTIVSYMELNALKVFESAAVDTSIIHFIKQTPSKESEFKYYEPTPNDKDDLKSTPHLLMKQNVLSTESFIFANATLLDLRDKIESVGTPLKDWDIQINYGIKTGANEAFIIPTEKREEILNACKTQEERERTERLIKPILRGKDIKRYSYEWAHLWVINTHNGYTSSLKSKIPPIDIEKYPAIKAHLDAHYDTIATRCDQGDTPYHLRNCAYLEDFEKEKIVWASVGFVEYCMIPGLLILDTNYFFEVSKFGNTKNYLLGLLNSKLLTFWLKAKNTPLGDMGAYRNYKYNIMELPMVKITAKNKKIADKIIALVDKILQAKEKDPKANTQKLEKEIDALVYQLYHLTDEEIKIIEEGQ